MSAERSGDMLVFTAPEGTTVELYSADGRLLTSKTLEAGSESIATDAFSGLVIVRMTNGTDNYLKKILF